MNDRRFAVVITTDTMRTTFAVYAMQQCALAVAKALRRVGIAATAVRIGA